MALHSVSAVLVEPVALFEFGVAVKVFGVDRTDDGVPAVTFRVCSARPGSPLVVEDSGQVTITADHGLDALAGSDLIVVAATPVRPARQYPQDVLEALHTAYRAGATLLSLCTGAFLLGAAGLLDGRACTTHWMDADELARRHPEAAVDAGALFVDAGRVITSAGTAAGVDACLHMARREWGHAAATTIARRMVVPPHRDGGQQQFITRPIPQHPSDGLAPLLDWVLQHLDHEHTADSLARRAAMSRRTFARRFTAEVGTTPHRWIVQQRVLGARSLLEETDLAVEQVAARVGFHSAVVLRDHFRRELGISPTDYRRRFFSPTLRRGQTRTARASTNSRNSRAADDCALRPSQHNTAVSSTGGSGKARVR